MSKAKYDFYQTDAHVFVTILKRGLIAEQCKAQYENGWLIVSSEDEVLLNIQLAHPVSKSMELKCSPSKIEIKMSKIVSEQWETLEVKNEKPRNKPTLISWDKLAEDVDDEEQGDVNALFQKIYKDADDDTKKAMMKSYTESSGTVLSTNWQEISKKRTRIRPPEGMEFKKW
ncbi:unnamed protein product [Thelazia callipaeda]|uniref:SGS domain-containing protein n=1 Tax=Thelazia callipaeda TaxID=103827 RepID=A0A0N5D1B5_THECL|nr:unnamed protein product [Thelazia callipaeda]